MLVLGREVRVHRPGCNRRVPALGDGREALLSSHQVHHPEIALTSDTTATGIWALHDMVIDTEHDTLYEGAAYYHDEYVKQDGQWRISRTGYERVSEHYHQQHSASGWQLQAPDA